VIHTVDAFENKLNSPDDLCSRKCNFPFVNPQTGPIYVEGAQPGDTLTVTIHDITPTRDYAVTALIPNFGGLVATSVTRMLSEPLPEQTRVLPIRDGHVELGPKIRLPYRPFMGTRGAADRGGQFAPAQPLGRQHELRRDLSRPHLPLPRLRRWRPVLHRRRPRHPGRRRDHRRCLRNAS